MNLRGLLLLIAMGPLSAEPVWKGPARLDFGAAAQVELTEADPALPPLPRPGEDRLGPLALLGVQGTPDGRGWILTVQPLTAGTLVVPPLDLGDGRKTPEWRVEVPRTVPYGAPWMGVGGGQEDALPYLPFPWAWAALLMVPLIPLGWYLLRRWRGGQATRKLYQARRAFARHWPPRATDRTGLDAAHTAGRELLACRFGEEARSWGATTFEARGLRVWAVWVQSLDAARFGRREPAFPPLKELVAPLDARR
ncbi:MAG TPA: hypothetical protein PLC09_04120 [Holophaga sp.]|nr:hypothetical protein [Holophaga sp.]